MASYFANRLSLAYRRDTAVVTFFGVLAAIALQLQVHAYDNGSSFVIAQSALLAAMWATWYFGSVLRLKDRYQEYRAAAEGARVQVFWQIVGVTERTADHFLVGQESALDWIRRALRTVALIDGWRASAAGAHDGSLDEALLDLTTRHWIDAQASYFAGAVAQGHKKAARVGVWIAALFVLAALGFASRLLGGSLDPAAAMLLRQASGIVTTSALAVSAGLGGYLHVMAYGSLPNRYESMMLLMKRALAGLGMTAGQPDRVAKSRAILAAIGREALSENARWVILQQTLVVKP
jgi:hypothetical protein